MSKCRKTEAESADRPTDRCPRRHRRIPSPIRMCIISDLPRAVTWRRLPPVQPHGPDGLFVGNAGGIPAGWVQSPRQVEPSPRRLSALVPRVLSRLSEPALVAMVGTAYVGSIGFACCCRDVPSLRAQLPGRADPDCSSVGCVGRTKARHGRSDPRVEHRCHCRFVDVTEYFWISASHFQMMMDLPAVIPHRGYDRERGPDSRDSSLVTDKRHHHQLRSRQGSCTPVFCFRLPAVDRSLQLGNDAGSTDSPVRLRHGRAQDGSRYICISTKMRDKVVLQRLQTTKVPNTR